MATNTRTRRINIFINGKEVTNSIQGITAEMRKLEQQTRTLNRDSKEYHANIAKIRQLKGIINEHNQALRTTAANLTSLKGLANTFSKYWSVIMGTIGSMAGMIFSVRNLTGEYARFEEKLVDVQKTTGLSRDQVLHLNQSLKSIDTRLPQEQLLDLAYVAGKLGITAEKDILGFVKAADKITVALSKDLGGNAEETMNVLGKIVQLFGLKDTFGIEESLLKVGSAINSLGMSSTANERNIVNFTNRVASIGNMANISIADILGLGATIDALAISSEVGATAYGMFISKMAKQPAVFSNLAGMELGSFQDLINTDANEAFLRVLESIGRTEGGFTALTAAIGEAGLEGQRAVQVISGLAQQTDFLRSQQVLSNKEFILGTSILEEYNLKNNTAQATIEKNTKAIANMKVELGEKLQPVMIAGQKSYVNFLKVIQTLAVFLFENGRAIVSLTAAFVGYRIALAAVTLWNERLIIGTIGYRVAKAAQIVVDRIWIALVGTQIILTDLLTRKIGIATAATRLFSVALGMTGIPALISLLVGAGTALGFYISGLNSAKRETIDLAKETARLTKEKQASIIEEQIELETLTGVITKLNTGSSLRITLIKKLKENYPELLGYINAENVSNEELLSSIQAINSNIKERIRLAALEAKSEILKKKMVENAVKMLDVEDQRTKAQKEFDKLKEAGIRTDQARFDKLMNQFSQEHELYANANTQLENEFFVLMSQIETQQKTIKEAQIKAYETQRSEIKAILDLEMQQKEVDKAKVSSLNIQLAQIEKKLSITKKLAQEDSFSETNEMTEILKEKKRFTNGEINKAAHERNLKNIELKYIQGRLETRQYEENERIALEIKAQETIASIRESFGKEENEASGKKLKQDFDFQQASNKLMKDFLSGKIETEQEHNRQLLALEIKFLEEKLDSLKGGTEVYVSTENELFTKKIQQTKNRLEEEKALLNAATTDEIEISKDKYKRKKEELGLHNLELNDMNELQKRAYNNITKAHYKELDEIDAQRISDYLSNINLGYETSLELMRQRHRDELEAVGNDTQKKKELQEKQAKEEIEFISDHVKKIKAVLDKLRDSGVIDGLSLADDNNSPEELKVLADAYRKLNEALKELSNTTEKMTGNPLSEMDKKMQGMFGITKDDFFGFSASQWMQLTESLGEGWDKLKFDEKIESVSLALISLTNATAQYFDLLGAYENKAFDRQSQRNEQEKENLRQKLEYGLISQETYNAKIKEMDKDLDKQKAIIDRRQAQREKAMALFSAAIQGALAIIKTLDKPILAAIVGLAVAAQIAVIAATPIPEIPGAETGGHLYKRSQDGKVFNASYNPNKRGYVNKPTVITGENGMEYIVPNEAMSNPTIRPVLDFIEMARLNDNLATVNLNELLGNNLSMSSGQILGSPNVITERITVTESNPKLEQLMEELLRTNKSLESSIKKGIRSYVTLYGRNGLYDAFDDDDIIRKNGNI